MATEYRITLSMTPETLEALDASGYALYGFAAVACSDTAGRPLVWARVQRYGARTVVRWSGRYEAYTSTDAIRPGRPVLPGFSAAIEPGQVLTVRNPAGTGEVTLGPGGENILILNRTQTPFTCGISQNREGEAAPACAFPLYGNGLQIIAPLPKVLLMFSTSRYEPGAVAGVATGPGVLVDMAGATERALGFDINAGWSWGGATWGAAVPAGTRLTPLLVEPSTALASLAKRMSLAISAVEPAPPD